MWTEILESQNYYHFSKDRVGRSRNAWPVIVELLQWWTGMHNYYLFSRDTVGQSRNA